MILAFAAGDITGPLKKGKLHLVEIILEANSKDVQVGARLEALVHLELLRTFYEFRYPGLRISDENGWHSTFSLY